MVYWSVRILIINFQEDSLLNLLRLRIYQPFPFSKVCYKAMMLSSGLTYGRSFAF